MPESQRLGGRNRSPRWRATRKAYLRLHPKCEISGVKRRLQVHHIIPFHKDPSKELDFDNLKTVTKWLHFWLCHLGSWHSWNENLQEDIKIWRDKIANRP